MEVVLYVVTNVSSLDQAPLVVKPSAKLFAPWLMMTGEDIKHVVNQGFADLTDFISTILRKSRDDVYGLWQYKIFLCKKAISE